MRYYFVTENNLSPVIESVYVALKDLDQVSKAASDLLECRVERLLQDMSSCPLLLLPVSPVSPQDLLLQTDSSAQAAAATLSW